ncbi:MAG: hypothetical protein EOP53_25720 [Sphingobacteriales bacterium]|nr:MAG: hypothetical protein EOP53_25720 [Sphingobacteriales bacterium]
MKNLFVTILILLLFLSLTYKDNSQPKDFGSWKKYACNIAGIQNGTLNRKQLYSIYTAKTIDPPKPIKGCSVKIKSFTFLHINLKTLPAYRETVKGDQLTGTIKGKIGKTRIADYIIFENIVGECIESKEHVELSPIVFNYNDSIPANF